MAASKTQRKPTQARKPPQPKAQAAAVQAAVEGASLPDDKIEFFGETYKIADDVGIWPLMQFARAAEAGVDTADFRALAALHAFLQDCLHPDDWGRFQEDMIRKKITDADKMLDMATQVVEKLTSRPTRQPSGSAKSPQEASDGSTGESSSPAEEG